MSYLSDTDGGMGFYGGATFDQFDDFVPNSSSMIPSSSTSGGNEHTPLAVSNDPSSSGRKRGNSSSPGQDTDSAFKRFTEGLKNGTGFASFKLRCLNLKVDSSVSSRITETSPFVLPYLTRGQDFGYGIHLRPEQFANTFLQPDFVSTSEALTGFVSSPMTLETQNAIYDLAVWMTNAREDGTSPFSYLPETDLFLLENGTQINVLFEEIDAPKEDLTAAQIFEQFLNKLQERGLFLGLEKASFLLTKLLHLKEQRDPPIYAAGYRKFSRERLNSALKAEDLLDLADIAALLFRSVIAECFGGIDLVSLEDVPKTELLALYSNVQYEKTGSLPEDEDFNVFNARHCALPTSIQRRDIDHRLRWEGTTGYVLKKPNPEAYKAAVAEMKHQQHQQYLDVFSNDQPQNQHQVPPDNVFDDLDFLASGVVEDLVSQQGVSTYEAASYGEGSTTTINPVDTSVVTVTPSNHGDIQRPGVQSVIQDVNGFLYCSQFVARAQEFYVENKEGPFYTFVLEHHFSKQEIQEGTRNGGRTYKKLHPDRLSAFYNIIKHFEASSWNMVKLENWLTSNSSHIRYGTKPWNDYNSGGSSVFLGKTTP